MNKIIPVIYFCLAVLTIPFLFSSCQKKSLPGYEVLEFYRKQSSFTDPGVYAGLYKNLPESYPDLFNLIKAQLIHPDADLPLYRNEVPADRTNEDDKYTDIKSILTGLMKYNSNGLIYDRKPAERLLLTCRSHSLLLASILRNRGIPVRLRYGFASYLIPGYHINHVVCEVWNSEKSRWILIDPDRQIVDVPSGKFEYAPDVWRKFVKNQINPDVYGVPGLMGKFMIYCMFTHDIASVLGKEHVPADNPQVCANPFVVDDVSSGQKNTLNKAASLLGNTDNNFDKIKSLYEKTDFLQIK